MLRTLLEAIRGESEAREDAAAVASSDTVTSPVLPEDGAARGLPVAVVRILVKVAQALAGKNIRDWAAIDVDFDAVEPILAAAGFERDVRRELAERGVRFVRGPPWLGVVNFVAEDGTIYIVIPENASPEAIAHEIWAVLNPTKAHNENPIQVNYNSISSQATPTVAGEVVATLLSSEGRRFSTSRDMTSDASSETTSKRGGASWTLLLNSITQIWKWIHR